MKFPYWGIVQYEVQEMKSGGLKLQALHRAKSERRSLNKSIDDANATNLPIIYGTTGRIHKKDLDIIIESL